MHFRPENTNFHCNFTLLLTRLLAAVQTTWAEDLSHAFCVSDVQCARVTDMVTQQVHVHLQSDIAAKADPLVKHSHTGQVGVGASGASLSQQEAQAEEAVREGQGEQSLDCSKGVHAATARGVAVEADATVGSRTVV